MLHLKNYFSFNLADLCPSLALLQLAKEILMAVLPKKFIVAALVSLRQTVQLESFICVGLTVKEGCI